MNKDREGDRILAELFKILKDNAIQCASKFGKLSNTAVHGVTKSRTRLSDGTITMTARMSRYLKYLWLFSSKDQNI